MFFKPLAVVPVHSESISFPIKKKKNLAFSFHETVVKQFVVVVVASLSV